MNFWVLWVYCGDAEKASNKARDKVVLFLAWLVFFPAAQYLIQEELNKHAQWAFSFQCPRAFPPGRTIFILDGLFSIPSHGHGGVKVAWEPVVAF